MNIIKFKDTYRVGDNYFNKYLKGKYAYFIHMQYAVPMDSIAVEQYMEFEQNVDKLFDSEYLYWDINKSDMASYIDAPGTDEANDVSEFKRYNKYTTDADITLEELRKFRTWLAKTLLEFDQNDRGEQMNRLYSEPFTYVLQYYAGGMYNDVIKRLMEFSDISKPTQFDKCGSLAPSIISPCGCGRGAAIEPQMDTCDPIAIYRSRIHDVMVKHFREVPFWEHLPVGFLAEFKMYIDNIVRMELPLRSEIMDVKFMDCSKMCQTKQLADFSCLSNLSKALDYMMAENVHSHRNFISNALFEWSDKLYEKMQWGQ